MGVPQDTGVEAHYTQEITIEKVCYWTKVIEEHDMSADDAKEFYQELPRLIGPKNYSFPKDHEWLLNGTPLTLGAMTIKQMTRKTGGLREAPPNCQKAWNIRLKVKIPWKPIWRSVSTYFTTHRDELTWIKLTHRALAVANRFDPGEKCLCCQSAPESMLHLCQCSKLHEQYWDFFFNFIHHMGFTIPINKVAFLATRRYTNKSVAPEEVIGIFSIAWRCLYAEITKTRLENHIFTLKDAKRRAICLLHSRLTAYGKLCKDFSSERRYTGRKYLLPKKLSKRTLIKVYRNGDYDIHDNITQGAILVSQKDAP